MVAYRWPGGGREEKGRGWEREGEGGREREGGREGEREGERE